MYSHLLEKIQEIQKEEERLAKEYVGTSEKVQKFLEEHQSTLLTSGVPLAELVKRPELTYQELAEIDKKRPVVSEEVAEQVNINLKYEGYIKRQLSQVEQFKKLEKHKIPEDIDYHQIQNLRLEARQKLDALRPSSVGQASRITGVSPADITVLLVYLKK